LKVLENVDALVVDLRNNGAETRISSVLLLALLPSQDAPDSL